MWPLGSTTTREVIFFSSMMARASAANALPSMVTGVGFMIWPAVWSRARLPSRSRRRRRSPSEIIPRSFSLWRTVVMPSFLRDIS
jgi:hypothetical protein